MANPRALVSKSTRRLLFSLNSSTSRPLFYTSLYFSCSSRSLTRPNLISSWPVSASASLTLCRPSFSIEDGTKPHNLPKVGPLDGEWDERDPGRWLCLLWTSGVEFKSEEEMLDKYVKLVVEAIGCSEYEAKQRIYFVCHSRWGNFAFGVKIDKCQAAKLQTSPYVQFVFKDFNFCLRDNSEMPIRKFSPLNWNGRLVNMFDYYNSNSDCNNNANATGGDHEDSGHWLINISKPDGRPDASTDYCFELLAEFVGSIEKACKKVYAFWLNGPYGFGAEIDKETAKKLQEHPNVLQVLQDHSFDIKDKRYGILCVYNSERHAEPLISYIPAVGTSDDDSDSSVSDGAEDTD